MKKRVRSGLEVFLEEKPDWIKGLKMGLLSNQASVGPDFTHSRHLINQAYPGQLAAIYSPQHGFRGEKQDNMMESEDLVDPELNIPIFSLYSYTRRPTPEMMDPIDVIIIDIQEVGCRVYTFISTVAYLMTAAADFGKELVILDRPNPIGGLEVEGNILKQHLSSFVGLYPIPMRHGMTIGEMAGLFNQEFEIGCSLHVMRVDGWRREMYFPETGLPWVLPSPNMPTPETAIVYPGQVVLEGTNASEGRGTTKPFELFGAPYIEPAKFKAALDRENLPGVIFREAWFEPRFSKWTGQLCGGLQIHVVDKKVFRPYLTTLTIISRLLELYPETFKWRQDPYEYEDKKLAIDLLLGNETIRRGLEKGAPPKELETSWAAELATFMDLRAGYLLYK
ncbi:MAG: DUF1343 domain-containing protein [Deltaproteobacteria bacterium]|nr:DUF1343 domain-containing protein [Deltaproteobacteria bacterium]